MLLINVIDSFLVPFVFKCQLNQEIGSSTSGGEKKMCVEPQQEKDILIHNTEQHFVLFNQQVIILDND